MGNGGKGSCLLSSQDPAPSRLVGIDKRSATQLEDSGKENEGRGQGSTALMRPVNPEGT